MVPLGEIGLTRALEGAWHLAAGDAAMRSGA